MKSRFLLKKITFHTIKCFCEKREGHSKRERMEIIGMHLKRCMILLKTALIPQIVAIFHLTSRDMSRDPSEYTNSTLACSGR